MTAHSSSRGGRKRGERAVRERGAVLALVAVALLVLLASTGLAVDLGRGYVAKLRIARAVDAAALAGARALRLGQAENEARAVFRANIEGLTPLISFGTNDRGEDTVQVSANDTLDTSFMRVLGVDTMEIGASGVAAVPPLDIVLVLDVSGSLDDMGAWDDLQRAATDFVRFFDDEIDQMGLVAFQVGGTVVFPLGDDFSGPMINRIKYELDSDGDTNIDEGLRLAREQIIGPSARDAAAKAVVFFTDGRATALRGHFGYPGMKRDRILAVYRVETNVLRGYFNNPDSLVPPYDPIDPSGCVSNTTCFNTWNEDNVRAAARQAGLDEAELIRQRPEGIFVYSIGLGNPDASEIETPDLQYLCEIANSREVANSSADDCDHEPVSDQLEGKTYFAPTEDELQEVFEQVARDLIVRLAK